MTTPSIKPTASFIGNDNSLVMIDRGEANLILMGYHANLEILGFRKKNGDIGTIINHADQGGNSPFNTFHLWKHLREDSFSHFFKVKHPLSGLKIAVRVAKKFDNIQKLVREDAIIKKLHERRKIPNLLDSFGYQLDTNRAYLFLELGTNLSAYIPLSLKKILFLSQQLFAGLEAMHDRRFIHGDINPQNLIITPKGILKISNFSSSEFKRFRIFDLPYKQQRTRSYYIAPELLLKQSCDEKIDIWAAACTISELMRGTSLFQPIQPASKFLKRIVFNQWKIRVSEKKFFNGVSDHATIDGLPISASRQLHLVLSSCLEITKSSRLDAKSAKEDIAEIIEAFT